MNFVSGRGRQALFLSLALTMWSRVSAQTPVATVPPAAGPSEASQQPSPAPPEPSTLVRPEGVATPGAPESSVSSVVTPTFPASPASRTEAASPKTTPSAPAHAGDALPSVASKTAGLERKDGMLTLLLDRARGKVWLELPPRSGDGEVGRYLYVEGLVTGLGSNPVGLDRGQLGPTRIVSFRRVGGRLLIEQTNDQFRAVSESPEEQRAVRESFATSVLWGGEIVAHDPDGRALVDFTSFVVRDAHQVIATLKDTDQGDFSLDASRSAVELDACLAFPKNLELQALLTYAGSKPGQFVSETAPSPQAITLIQHQSLLELPDTGYRPRAFDPRAGYFAIAFLDYARPIADPIETRWIVRHRLEKTDPKAERSKAKEPIVYYVDPGAPEPIRTALLEGAGWWSKAFDAAGFIDGFRVELLPAGAHPLDARYNVIQWVHRSTRGWSYGGGVIDPRTGEMIKGHVTLGSLRVRHDRLIFEGLLGTENTGRGGLTDPVELSLWRIRQLAAHEVGHTLGLVHNFAASTYGRASVMDYPAPFIRVTPQGDLDASSAYATGAGEWDIHAIKYGYTELAAGPAEQSGLDAIVQDGLRRGLVLLSDADARGPGAAEPRAALWDNGDDPVSMLEQELQVRKIGLARFGEHNIAKGQPLALLQEVLVPVYFHHRYQLEAAIKVIGGLSYTYALRGDGQPPARPIDGQRQRRALKVILGILEPEVLDLPDSVLALLMPRPLEYGTNREMFKGSTAPAFDPLGAAATAADMVVRGLLQRERNARLVDFHRRDPAMPGLEEVLEALRKQAFGRPRPANERQVEIARVIQRVVLDALIDEAKDPATAHQVRYRLEAELAKLRAGLEGTGDSDAAESAHRKALAALIGRYLDREGPEVKPQANAPEAPPGMPIGAWSESDEDWCGTSMAGFQR